MEAATAPSAGAAKAKSVSFGSAPLTLTVVGGVVTIVGCFLKAFTVPHGVIYTGSTNFLATSGGKIVLGAVVVGLIFLAIAAASHRKGVLWGTYICAVIAILIAALDAGGGFTLSLVGGGSVKANAAVGVFVALGGSIVMMIGAIATRQSSTPA